jgi:hypothetical protein
MDLIGNGKNHLVPAWQPKGTGEFAEGTRGKPFATQHTRPVGPPAAIPPKNPKAPRGRGRNR